MPTAPQSPAEAPQRDLSAPASYRVEMDVDEARPGFSFYRILGLSAADVQAGIDKIMAEVDPVQGGVPGCAQFSHPKPLFRGNGWHAFGTVQVAP